MSLPTNEQIPDDPNQLPPARRRRARRLLAPLEADERAAFLDRLAHRASPSFDFFLFSLLAGAVLSIGLLLNSPAILVLGAVLAPLMAPAVGVSLGTVIGSVRFFVRSLAGLLIGSLLVFLVGVLAGYAIRPWLPVDFSQAHLQAQLSWPNFLVLAVGAILTCASIVHLEGHPGAPSVALAYGLYIPLVVAGIGLGCGEPHLWPDGLVVYAIYLAWGSLLGAATLAIMGFRPLTLFGYTLGAAVALTGVILLIGISGAGAAVGGQVALPTPIPSDTPTVTATLTVTPSPVPPTFTPTPTVTTTPVPPTLTSTTTPSPAPTPMLALVKARDGALLRETPGGKIIRGYIYNTLIKVFPEVVVQDGRTWVRVQTPDGTIGWMDQAVLVTATPAPNW
jgi:hypothetical protein